MKEGKTAVSDAVAFPYISKLDLEGQTMFTYHLVFARLQIVAVSVHNIIVVLCLPNSYMFIVGDG